MNFYDLAIINGKIYQDGDFVNSNLYIRDGMIVNVSTDSFEAERTYDAKGNYVLPGFIDPHVHFNLRVGGGRASSDDFHSGSITAAYGGVTTYIDFLDPVEDRHQLKEAFENRMMDAKDSVIDYGFHSTIANFKDDEEGFINDIKGLGISSIKFFTTYSSSNRMTFHNTIRNLLNICKNENVLLLSHSEDDHLIKEGKFSVRAHGENRPTISETVEVLALAEMTRETEGKMYIVHVSSGRTLERVKENYGDILNKSFFIESCPQYFYLSKDNYEKENGYLYTMAPPLRSRKEADILEDNIDFVDTIGTDHCPFTSIEKNKETLDLIPMGIGGIEHSFQLMYTAFGDKVIDKFTKNPAKLHGLYPKKGSLIIGADADIVIFNPNDEYKIEESHSRCDYDLYRGIKVKGRIITTISRGRIIMDKGQLLCDEGGEYVKRI
ncbi:dihydroorotase [Clostridium culturomicium]|uniref:dihydroorotase n=1 Tax=Clostridium culturomicium TaxID=1499683 RepID=UPI00058CB429|nr:amidohydrolase family protein [Clostridium culturomicium]